MIVVARDLRAKVEMLAFLNDRGVKLNLSEDFQAIGRVSENDNAPIGVVAFNGFTGRVCIMHCAGEGNWITREFLRAAFGYPFVQLRLAAVMAPVAASNTRAIRLDKHLGFREVHRVVDGWDTHADLVLLQMLREECRFVEQENEARVSLAA